MEKKRNYNCVESKNFRAKILIILLFSVLLAGEANAQTNDLLSYYKGPGSSPNTPETTNLLRAANDQSSSAVPQVSASAVPAPALASACADLANVSAWKGRITFSYSHSVSGNINGLDQKAVFQESSDVSFNIHKTGSNMSKIGWAGDATGFVSINDGLTYYYTPPTPPETLTEQGSGTPLTAVYGDPTFMLNADSNSCKYRFSFVPQINAVLIDSYGGSTPIVTGSMVRSGDRSISGTNLNISESASFPVISPASVLSATGDYYVSPFAAPYSGLVTDANAGSATVTWEFTPADDSVDDPCTQEGSIIECQNQVLGESVDISGTPFSLNYQSDRAPGSSIGTWLSGGWYAKAQGIGGWTLNVHHFFDPDFKVLHLGDGARRSDLMQAAITNNISIPSEDGNEIYIFNKSGWHLRTLDAFTGAVRYQFSYDGAGRLTGVTDGSGNTVTIQRNPSGNATAIISPYGQRTNLTWDTGGYLTSITNPKGETIHLNYTKILRTTPLLCGGKAFCLPYINTTQGLLANLTDSKGNLHSFSYDNNARLIRDKDPAGGFKVLKRNDTTSGYSVTLSTALNRNTTYLVENLATGGQRRLTIFPDGIQTEANISANSWTINYSDGMRTTFENGPDPRFGWLAPLLKNMTIKTPKGLMQTISSNRTAILTDPNNSLSMKSLTDTISINGLTYTSTFTAASKNITAKTPMGRQTVTILDSKGRIAEERISGITPVKYIYDTHGRLSIINQGTRNYTFKYDSLGNLANITDPLLRIQRFNYDPAGRMIKQILPDGRYIQYAYDASGNVISITPPGHPNHTFGYTPVDMLQNYLPPKVGTGTNPTSYTYNIDRQLTRITRPDGIMINLSYDSAGRLSTIKLPQGTINMAYDLTTGKVKAITAPDGGTIRYAYDGSLLLYINWSGTIAGSVHRTYDNNFSIVSEDVNGKNAINFKFDRDGLLIRAGILNLNRNSQNGLLTGTSVGNITDNLTYNSFAEVTAYQATVKGKNIFSIQYTRDNIGRITRKNETINGTVNSYNYTYDTAGRLINVRKNGVLVSGYVYDANGNRLNYTGQSGKINGTYDDQDRLIKYGTTTYIYTANGELLKKTAGSQNTTYQYDTLGNLVNVTLPGGKQIRYLVDGQNRRIGKKVNGTLVQGFLYKDGLRPIAELDGANNITSRFVYASGSNIPDYMVKGSITYRIISDHLGSPRLVINAATGVVAQRMDYDEFGKVIIDTNPGFQPFGFADGLYDRDTKLIRFGVRDYDADTGRWTAKDPIGFAASDTNLYGYALNDPVNLRDPSGLQVTRPPQPQPGDITKPEPERPEGLGGVHEYDETMKIPEQNVENTFDLSEKIKNLWKKAIDALCGKKDKEKKNERAPPQPPKLKEFPNK